MPQNMKQLLLSVISVWITALLFTAPSFGQQQTLSLSLEDAVELALENNREIKISEFDVEAAESGLREATGGFLPEVSASGQYLRNVKRPVIFIGDGFPGMEGGAIEVGSNNSYQATLTATLPLYSRQLIKGREAASRSRDLSEVNYQSTRNEVAGAVMQTYHAILLSQEVLEFTGRRIENAEQQLENVKRLQSEGLATEYDVLVAEVQLENLYPEYIQAEDDVESYMLELKNLMGIVDEGEIELTGELDPNVDNSWPHQQTAREMLASNYQLRLLESQLNLVQNSIELEQASLYPTLSIFGNYQYQTEANTFEFSNYDWINSAAIGLSLQVPIFSGNRNRERINQAEIDLKQLQEQRSQTEEALVTEFTRLTNRLGQIQRRIEATERALAQAERAYELSVMRFEQGLGTQIEINDSELAFASSQFNNLQALFDYQVALISLNQLQGQLTSQ